MVKKFTSAFVNRSKFDYNGSEGSGGIRSSGTNTTGVGQKCTNIVQPTSLNKHAMTHVKTHVMTHVMTQKIRQFFYSIYREYSKLSGIILPKQSRMSVYYLSHVQ